MIRVTSYDRGFFQNRLHINFLDELRSNSSTTRIVKDTAVATIFNDGPGPLTISGVAVTGAFEIINPQAYAGLVLQSGQSAFIRVAFDRDLFPSPPSVVRPNNVSGVFEGELRVFSNDPLRPTTRLNVAAHWQRKDEGGWEANVNEVWHVLGFGNRIKDLPFSDSGGPNPFDTFGLYERIDALEVLSPHWRIAPNATEATMTLIGRYAGPVVESLGVHRPFGKNSTAFLLETTREQSQTILPGQSPNSVMGPGGRLDPNFASATFTNTTIPDNWQGDDVFSFIAGTYSTDPSLNFTGKLPSNPPPDAVFGHWLRMFQAVDAEGRILPNTYLGIQDKAGINSDFNDIMFFVTGVAPVSRAPVNSAPSAVTVLENKSLAFTGANRISVTDPDGAALTTRMTAVLQVANGTLSVAPDPDVTITGSGTNLVKIVANSKAGVGSAQTLLNDALSSLVYRPRADFDGSDSLRISINDRALRDVDRVAISVVDTTFRVEAESMTLAQGFRAVSRSHASGGMNIEAVGSGEQIARTTFSGADGTWNIGVGHFDENDGVARLRVLVNGTQIDSWLWNQDTGSANPSRQALVERTISNVSLSSGDRVELRGFGAPGEPLRIDYLDFEYLGA